MNINSSDLFEDVTEFPNSEARRRYSQLVGLHREKTRLEKEARVLLNPKRLVAWSEQHYRERVALVDAFRARTPLFLFAGDVGTGKAVLAETFGDAVARQEDISVTLYRLSLSTRGSGAVGEMTKLLAAAFSHVRSAASRISRGNGYASAAAILLIDEADALAQSRELGQMHHEDRAGVNALIRGVDDLAKEGLPALVVMCTNRLAAIDPAIRRRAAATFAFGRPDLEQRMIVLNRALHGVAFDDDQIRLLAEVTGETPDRPYGYTYSDLVQRLLPTIVLDAFPDRPICFARALELARGLAPTPPFRSESM
jgi:AAA+ superfamily predicted ATPase